MGEIANNATDKAPKNSWFKGLKSELKKIVWPGKESITKQSVAVIIVTILLGVIIFGLDFIIENAIGIIIG
ncbi:MAG: preprotein translocase subunit SecE [Clostridiales bacterium]|jgi:preprotein translocase subunit SecE|nr:preprotein translocase subunit SecE [Clostridiales bacterium]